MKLHRVIATSAKGVWVDTNGEMSFYYFKGADLGGHMYPCALGDILKVDEADRKVIRVNPRDNLLIRVRREKSPQPVVSHVSLVAIVVCFNRSKFPTQFVDRLVVGIKQQGIPVEIIVTKKDRLSDIHLRWITRYADYMFQHARTRVHVVDARKPEDVAFFAQEIKPKEGCPVIAFAGPTGVGKSTLIQTLTGYNLSTTPVNKKTGKGRHTTTQPQMYASGKLWLADLPGIKVWFPAKENLMDYYPELIPLAGTLQCNIHGCDHVESHNPGCLLARFWKFAPSEGQREFGKLRYESYESILMD